MSHLKFNSITITTHGKKTAVQTELRLIDDDSVEVISIDVTVPTNAPHTLREIQTVATKRAIELLQRALPT